MLKARRLTFSDQAAREFLRELSSPMDISSAQSLCLHLISSAFQRCRVSEELCRLSVALKSYSLPDPPVVKISISDTGVGSCLEEFQSLKWPREGVSGLNWDGVLSITTTNISDTEIYHYQVNLKDNASSGRLIRFPSTSKNGGKFSGTEVCLSISESVDGLVAEINHVIGKILILNIPNVAIELVVEYNDVPGSQNRNVFLANEFNPLPFSASNVESLKSGLQDYVLKHGNNLNKKCDNCFSCWGNLKVGSAEACRSESNRSDGLIVEAVVVISELPETINPCFTRRGVKTEVLYFYNFAPISTSQSSINALKNIDWKKYGLALGSIEDQGGSVLIEWENLPPGAHIDIVIHGYHKQSSTRKKTQLDRNLVKKAVKLALDNLKENNAGVLLSAHALKVRGYAPDLAKTISGLILSSIDKKFREECYTLLGLPSTATDSEMLEKCIKGKIVSVIETNDRNPGRKNEAAAYLFDDDCIEEPGFDNDQEHEQGDDSDRFFD